MTHDQRENLILIALMAAGAIIIGSFTMYFSNFEPIKHPIESTRPVILTCTVKSNIEGVITLNDDCKITVVK